MNLSRETLERWYGEVEILKRLDHPNIVKAQNVPEGLNCSPMSNTPFICMEYCDGGDLRQVRVCVWRGVHRDLKPENILIKKIDPNKVGTWELQDRGS